MITLDDLRGGSPALCGSFNKIREEAIRAAGGDQKKADVLLTQRVLSEFLQHNANTARNSLKQRFTISGSVYDCDQPGLVAPDTKRKRALLGIVPLKKPEWAANNSGYSVVQRYAGFGYVTDIVDPDNKKRKKPDSAASNSGHKAEINRQQVGGKSMKPKKQRKNPRVMQQMGPDPPPNLPAKFFDLIMGMRGYDLKLVIQKELFDTDLSSHCDRLSIPKTQMRAEFLTKEEQANLEIKKQDGLHYRGMQVPLIEPSLEESSISLKRWKLGSGTTYILSSPWKEVAERNRFTSSDIIQLWSFKVDQRLFFALVKLEN